MNIFNVALLFPLLKDVYSHVVYEVSLVIYGEDKVNIFVKTRRVHTALSHGHIFESVRVSSHARIRLSQEWAERDVPK